MIVIARTPGSDAAPGEDVAIRVVLFHPRDGNLNDERLSEGAHPGIIDLLRDDVAPSIESGTNLTKAARIGVRCLLTVALPDWLIDDLWFHVR